MSRPKRTSRVLEIARRRLAALKALNPPPDFGPDLTIDEYEAAVNDFSAKLDEHNKLLAELGELEEQAKPKSYIM